jgi:poly-gamma-glutamate synthesis protein (capsule biosynthesis protein)
MAVGDIGFIGEVSKNIDVYGPEHPFHYVEPILSEGDIVFGNLEKPFAKNRQPFFKYLSKKSIANAKGIDSLVHGHFNIVSLANNHILDFGPEGLAYTMNLLNEKGIKYVGAGYNLEEARKPVIMEKKGCRIGFLAYSKKSEKTATKSKPGAAPIDYKNVIREDIFEIRNKADILIVSLHFGLMYTDFPTIEDREVSRRIIECGADIIIGHHPHVIQGMEYYSKGIIIYSLGEFLFDSKMGNVHIEWAEDKRKESLISCLSLSQNGISDIKIYPIILNASYQPRYPEFSIQEKIKTRFDKMSKIIYTQNKSELNKSLGFTLINHQSRVFYYHLRRLNLLYILRKISKIRGRHLFYFIGYVSKKIGIIKPK